MIPKSVRWRLPLSYAAIALLTALSLGIVLLTTLRTYYRQQELDYLTNNAQAIGSAVTHLIDLEMPHTVLQSQFRSFAFLSQTRVRWLDRDSKVVVDSGAFREQQGLVEMTMDFSSIPAALSLTAFSQPKSSSVDSSVPDSQATQVYSMTLPTIDVLVDPATGEQITLSNEIQSGPSAYQYSTYAAGTPFGFGLDIETPLEMHRSEEVVHEPLYGREGQLLGYVELSEGPTYGRQVLERVAWGLVMAGSVALLLSTGVGWAASRSLTVPVLALTDVTTQMARGDLSVRAGVDREDELGQLAIAFNRMAGRIEGTVTTLRRFVADAAHELNTPLTALRTNLELIMDAQDVSRQGSLVGRAQAQVVRLESLTSSLLDLSQLEGGAESESKEAVELTTLVREMSELYASRAEQLGLSFSLELPEEQVTILARPGQLRQALDNLLDNAIKFTQEGGEISVGLHRMGKAVMLWVEDSGIGVPVDDLPHLFNRFHRGRNVSEYPGNGLGLAIVRAVVEGHGGQVTVASTERGTRFEMQLPTRMPANQTLETQAQLFQECRK